jgi:hypothetical protein
MLTEKIIDFIGIMACIIMIVCICAFAIGFCFNIIDNKQSDCAYCHGTINEDADYVCMTDGRKLHAECYMRAIKEDGNGTD